MRCVIVYCCTYSNILQSSLDWSIHINTITWSTVVDNIRNYTKCYTAPYLPSTLLHPRTGARCPHIPPLVYCPPPSSRFLEGQGAFRTYTWSSRKCALKESVTIRRPKLGFLSLPICSSSLVFGWKQRWRSGKHLGSFCWGR